MLDIEECRRVFAKRITRCADEKQSFERALMAACEFAYRRGLEDGAINAQGAICDELKTIERRRFSE
jgi:hypothetical protein